MDIVRNTVVLSPDTRLFGPDELIIRPEALLLGRKFCTTFSNKLRNGDTFE